jgi:hypothetical protein
MVADRQASSRRTLGWCLEQGMGFVTLVPRPWSVRQARAAWGQQPSPRPLVVEQPGRTKREAPRRWHGQRVRRPVEGEYRGGRTAQEAVRCVVGHARQLAPPHAQASGAAQAQAAQAVADHVRQVHARWCAGRPDAEAAIAESAGRGRERRGRRPRPWRYHTVRSRIVAATRHTRRARRGRPAQTDLPPTASGDRVVVEVGSLSQLEEDHGWTVLATTVPHAGATDAEMLQAYHDQTTTGEPGFRWIKNPAAMAPVWLEKPARMAALARLTVIGLRVYRLIPRQVRVDLRTPDQQIPGNKGLTATPTAAVVALCAHLALVQFQRGAQESEQVYGVQPDHLLCGDALGLDRSWYETPSAQQSGRSIQTP